MATGAPEGNRAEIAYTCQVTGRIGPYGKRGEEPILRACLVSIAFLVPVGASADSLVLVEDAVNPCAEFGCMYYEWRIADLPDIRYVASGFEDGIDYSLQQIRDDGSRETLLYVNPVVIDADGNFWWGYPWATTGIVLANVSGQVLLHATFEHDIERDGQISTPEWQAAFPALLLEGTKGDWNVPVASYPYSPISIADLVAAARSESH